MEVVWKAFLHHHRTLPSFFESLLNLTKPLQSYISQGSPHALPRSKCTPKIPVHSHASECTPMIPVCSHASQCIFMIQAYCHASMCTPLIPVHSDAILPPVELDMTLGWFKPPKLPILLEPLSSRGKRIIG